MKGKFNDVSEMLRDNRVTRLDLDDFPKQNSTEANTVHFVTTGSNINHSNIQAGLCARGKASVELLLNVLPTGGPLLQLPCSALHNQNLQTYAKKAFRKPCRPPCKVWK